MRKRIVSLFILVALLCSFLPQLAPTVSAALNFGICGDNLEWFLNTATGVLEISGSGEMYDGIPWALYKKRITSVRIHDGVTTIGKGAFIGCPNLVSVSIPESVEVIGKEAFQNCKNLDEVEIPEGVKIISEGAFRNCTSLRSVSLPGTLLEIGAYAFENVRSLTAIGIPNSVTTIGRAAFKGCNGLTNVVLSEQLTVIPDELFSYCMYIKTIFVPESVTYIGKEAFYANHHNVVILNPQCTFGAVFNCCEINHGLIGFKGSTAESFCPEYFEDIEEFLEDWGAYVENIDSYTERILIVKADKTVEGPLKLTPNYALCQGATAVYAGESTVSDKNGCLIIPAHWESVTISKEGYVARTYSKQEIMNARTVYLQRESPFPVISALWMDNRDIINESYEISLYNSGTFTLTPEINWGSSRKGRVYLTQGDQSVEIVGKRISIPWNQYFDMAKPIHLVATNELGLTTRRKLKLNSTRAIRQALADYKLDVGSFSFPMPKVLEEYVDEETIDCGIYTNIPVRYAIEDGKIYVAIGFGGGTEYDGGEVKVKSFVQSLKSIYDDYSSKGAKKFLQEWKNDIKKQKGSLAFGADFFVMGFREGIIREDATFDWKESGMIISVGAEMEYSIPFYFGMIPMFIETKLSTAIEEKVKLYTDPEQKRSVLDGVLEGEFKVEIGAGVGIKHWASISGGGRGKLACVWEQNYDREDAFRLNFTVNGYLKAEFLFSTWEKHFKPCVNEPLIVYPQEKHLTEVSDLGIPKDTAQFKVQDLSYLQAGSDFLANEKSAKRAVDMGSATYAPFLTNTYTGAKPQLVTFADGTMLAVWAGFDESRNGYNRLCLYQSYYNGIQWSEPAVVEADGTYDAEPKLVLIEDCAYLTWLNSQKSLTDETSLEAVSQNLDIRFATFNRESLSFTAAPITEGNDVLDMLPVVCGGEGSLYVVWLRNSSNDFLGTQGENTILCRRFDGTEWGQEEILYENVGSIDSLTACVKPETEDNWFEDGNWSEGDVPVETEPEETKPTDSLQVVYCVDTDGNPETLEDMELFKNGVQFTDNEVQDSGAYYLGDTLFWAQDGTLELDVPEYEKGDGYGKLPTDRYQLIEKDDTTVLLYTLSDGLCSTLYATFRDKESSGRWGKPIALTDGTHHETGFSASISPQGNLEILLNRVSVVGEFDSEAPYGETSLELLTIPLACDLSIETVEYSGSDYYEGSAMPFHIVVQNHGSKKTDYRFAIELRDQEGNYLSSQDYYENLLPGESLEVSYTHPIQSPTMGETFVFTVRPNSMTDGDLRNNSAEVVMDYTNIMVQDLSWDYNEAEELFIHAGILNRSHGSFENVLVNLRSESTDGEILEAMTIEALAPMSAHSLNFTYPIEMGKTYYVTIEAQDSNPGDNRDFIVPAYQECDHDYVMEHEDVGCMQYGVTTYTCSMCGYGYCEELVEPYGHTWNEGELQAEPTCTEDGSKLFQCATCGETEIQVLEAFGHAQGELIRETEQAWEYACLNGDHSITIMKDERLLAMKLKGVTVEFSRGEDYPWAISRDDSVTGCHVLRSSNQGIHSSDSRASIYFTANRDFTLSFDYLVSSEYDYDTMSIDLDGSRIVKSVSGDHQGTYTSELLSAGTHTLSLSYSKDYGFSAGTDSGYIFHLSAIAEPCEHSYTEYTDNGEDHTLFCVDCRDSRNEPHSYEKGKCICGAVEVNVVEGIGIGHTLSLVSDISLNYVTPKRQLEGYDSFYMECVVPTYSGNQQTGERSFRLQPVERGSNYYFTLDGLFAFQMADMVSATLHMTKNGAEYVSKTDVYSITSYAYNQLNKAETSPALKKICANLLQYGATVQTWKNYRTDALADGAMTEANRAYLTKLSDVSFNSNKDTLDDFDNAPILWKGNTLSLESKVVMRFVFINRSFQGDLTKLSLHISYTNCKGQQVECVVEGASVYDETYGYYVFEFESLPASEMRSVLSAVVYHGETRISQTRMYSVDTYGVGKQGIHLTLSQAMVAYGDSAAAYFSQT